jgi:hypothetical protein
MRLPALAALLSMLGACAAPPTELTHLPNQELLNRLPARLGAMAAQGPIRVQNETASRSYAAVGALAVVTLGRPNAAVTVPDGPDDAETRVLLERLTSNLVANVSPVPPFGPWRREADIRVQNQDGPPLRCAVLRRPRGEGAQVQYNCITGLFARYLTVAVNVNHDAMNAQGAQSLAANLAGNIARMLATGNGLVVPAAASGGQPKAPVAPAVANRPAVPDDAVPD